MAESASVAPSVAEEPHGGAGHEGFWALALGSMGVVFGDIGTSPLYAMREALHHTRATVSPELAVLGVVSLVTWALILIVTIKYVVFLMRADNKGEGGTLALMALAQRSLKTRSTGVFFLGVVGAALFYGDGIITPAVSVLSAVEGLRDAPGAPGGVGELVLPISGGILIALFLVQSRGTASVAKFFGPITAIWFLVLAGLGVIHIVDDLSIFRALSPHYGVLFLIGVSDGHSYQTLQSIVIDPHGARAHQQWYDATFSLEEYAGLTVDIILNTRAGEAPTATTLNDVAVWGAPRVVAR